MLLPFLEGYLDRFEFLFGVPALRNDIPVSMNLDFVEAVRKLLANRARLKWLVTAADYFLHFRIVYLRTHLQAIHLAERPPVWAAHFL